MAAGVHFWPENLHFLRYPYITPIFLAQTQWDNKSLIHPEVEITYPLGPASCCCGSLFVHHNGMSSKQCYNFIQVIAQIAIPTRVTLITKYDLDMRLFMLVMQCLR